MKIGSQQRDESLLAPWLQKNQKTKKTMTEEATKGRWNE